VAGVPPAVVPVAAVAAVVSALALAVVAACEVAVEVDLLSPPQAANTSPATATTRTLRDTPYFLDLLMLVPLFM
jgi:hypothetical protein